MDDDPPEPLMRATQKNEYFTLPGFTLYSIINVYNLKNGLRTIDYVTYSKKI